MEQIAPARIEEKKRFATPVLTSVEMMQIDDGKDFKAFLEGEKLKTDDPATRAKFDKLIAEIDEAGATIVGVPAPVAADSAPSSPIFWSDGLGPKLADS